MEAHTDAKMIEEDALEKRIANESIANYWKYMGFKEKPLGDDKEDQTNGSKNVQPRSFPRNSQNKPSGEDEEDQTNGSKNVQPRSFPKNSQRDKTHQPRYQKIPKGRKNQFELVQFIKYSSLFKNGVSDFNKDSETVKLDVDIVDTEEVESIKDSAVITCLLYTSPSPRDRTRSRMPSSA